MSDYQIALPTRESDPGLWVPPPATSPRHHIPRRPNPNEMTGGRGGGGGGLGRNAEGYYVQNGIYWPLMGLDAGNPLQGGYGFGDRTDLGRTFHPGADGNAGGACNNDEGAPCVAPCDGVVVAVLNWDGRARGEGNHLWCYLDDPNAIAPAWMHWDHLQSFHVKEGDNFIGGEVLATCGRTGGWLCAHLHLEFAKQRPASWWQWPFDWSLAQMEAAYFRPYWWFTESAAKAGNAGQEVNDVRTGTTAEERAAAKPYFEMYGIGCNMDTALMQRACLAYYREESPGPALTGEYGFNEHVRQDFTARTAEWHADDNTVYWVELNKEHPKG